MLTNYHHFIAILAVIIPCFFWIVGFYINRRISEEIKTFKLSLNKEFDNKINHLASSESVRVLETKMDFLIEQIKELKEELKG